tara:strand:- start:111 stop:1886 length:1776 start_codon:yes stop_codon:yes gene_type:complete
MSKKKNTAWFIQKAKSIHGSAFSYENAVYKNAKEKIKITCKKHNNPFYQTSNNHFNSKFPCDECRSDYMRTINSDQLVGFKNKMIEKFGDRFDYSKTRYTNQNTKVQLECKECNTKTNSTPRVLLDGIGCPKCHQDQVNENFSSNKIEEINAFVKQLGGRCLSDKYINNEHDLKFQCKQGHIFYESWSDIQFGLRWCKECSPNRYIGETLSRMILEHLLSTSFPSVYLESMNGLQLDGYCSKMNIAFEYQGYQHFTRKSHFHQTTSQYRSQRLRDLEKKHLCQANEIILIEIFEFKNIKKSRIPVFVEEVKRALDELNIQFNHKPFNLDLERLYRGRETTVYNKAKAIIAAANGNIQGYIGSESNHLVTCRLGHESKKKLSVLKKNGFNCSHCVNQEKYTKLKTSIEQRGGKLLTTRLKQTGYSNLYDWECDKGHKNTTKGQYLINKHWCRRCQINNQTTQIDKEYFIKVAADTSFTTDEKLQILNIKSGVFYTLLKKFQINNLHRPQNRRSQDVSSKSKGEILQIDPKSLKILRKYKYLEAVRLESNGKFKPEGIRHQMKKNKPAYGYYWVRTNDYDAFRDSNFEYDYEP